MDGALFSLLFFFFVQISAGVAPIMWPQRKWLAGVIFWISTVGALVCLVWYGYSQDWIVIANDMLGQRVTGLLLLVLGIAVGVFGLSMIAAGDKPKKIGKEDVTFAIEPHVYSESRSIKAPDGRETNLYENTFHLIVANLSEDGKTLRKVHTEYRGYEAPVIAEIKDSTASEVDIKHGNAAFFVIGRIVSPKNIGLFKGSITMDDDLLKTFEHPAYGERPTVYVGKIGSRYQFGLGSPPYPPTGWVLVAVISAEDKKSRVVKLNVDARDQKNPVTFAKGEVEDEKR